MSDFRDEIKYPYEMMGFTFYEGGRTVCNKCGEEGVCGIIPMAMHWNKCIDGNKTLTALTKLREEKGIALTVNDIDKILK